MVPGSRSLSHQGVMEAREEMVAGTETESVHLQWQAASRGSTLGMVGGFEPSEVDPSNRVPSARSHLLKPPKECHQLGTKQSNTWAYGEHSRLNYQTSALNWPQDKGQKAELWLVQQGQAVALPVSVSVPGNCSRYCTMNLPISGKQWNIFSIFMSSKGASKVSGWRFLRRKQKNIFFRKYTFFLPIYSQKNINI